MKKIKLAIYLSIVSLMLGCVEEKYTEPDWNKSVFVEYNVVQKKSNKIGNYLIRYTLLNKKDTINDTVYHWLEMDGWVGETFFGFKMLIPYGYRDRAKAMIVKVKTPEKLEVVEMPYELSNYPTNLITPYLYNVSQIDSGKVDIEEINTPMGKFRCIKSVVRNKYTGTIDTVWVNNKIPLFRIVKVKTPESTMEIKTFSFHGIKSFITEKPIDSTEIKKRLGINNE